MSQNVHSIRAFGNWVEKQHPSERYVYDDCANCAYAQYLKSLGYDRVRVGVDEACFIDVMGAIKKIRLPRGLDRAVGLGSNCFGALAQRLDKLLAA